MYLFINRFIFKELQRFFKSISINLIPNYSTPLINQIGNLIGGKVSEVINKIAILSEKIVKFKRLMIMLEISTGIRRFDITLNLHSKKFVFPLFLL